MTIRIAAFEIDLRGRHRAIRLEGNVITFRCACGREYRKDYTKGPAHRRLTGDGLVLIFQRWQDGCTAPPCRRCQDTYRATGELPAGDFTGL